MKKVTVTIGGSSQDKSTDTKMKTKTAEKKDTKIKNKETKIKVTTLTTDNNNKKETNKSSGVKWSFKKETSLGDTKTKTSSSASTSTSRKWGFKKIFGAGNTKTSSSGTSSRSGNVEQGFTPVFSNVTPTVVFQQIKELHWTKMRIFILVLLFFIFVLHIICVTATNWLQFSTHQSHGLWRVCYQTDYTDDSMECFRFDAIAGT